MITNTKIQNKMLLFIGVILACLIIASGIFVYMEYDFGPWIQYGDYSSHTCYDYSGCKNEAVCRYHYASSDNYYCEKHVEFAEMLAAGKNISTKLLMNYITLSSVAIIVFVIYAVSSKKKAKKIDEMVEYRKESSELILKNRGKLLDSVLLLKQIRELKTVYHPEELHYGSVTVGGVTTGGVYKTGGYTSLKQGEKLGVYRLRFLGQNVDTIRLSPEMLEQAKNSPIAKYLNGTALPLTEKLHLDNNGAKEFMNSLKSNNYMTVDKKYTIQQNASKEKAYAIYSWLIDKK